MRTTKRFKFKMLLGLVLAGILCYVFRERVCEWPARLLVRADALSPDAPYAAILMGDASVTRARVACDLYKNRQVRKLIFTQEAKPTGLLPGLALDLTAAHVAYLEACGVAAQDLVVLADCTSTSTLEEARCIGEYFQRSGIPAHMLLITSWYHTSRAGWLFSRVMTPLGVQVQVVPAASATTSPHRWWQREDDFLEVFTEYLKWTYWLAKKPR